MKKIVSKTLTISLAVAFILFLGGMLHSIKAEKLPDLITIVTHKIGSVQYTHAVGFAEAINKVAKIKVRVEPRTGEPEKIASLKSGAAELMTIAAVAAYFPTVGKGEFSSAAWGPQPFRMVHVETFPAPCALGVRANSGIKTGADLKGKRVAMYPADQSRTQLVEGLLSFYGLTWNDVIKVPVAGYNQALEAGLDGSADAFYANVTAPLAYQIEASSNGLLWLQMPINNKIGWERFLKLAPGCTPWIQTSGPTISEARPLECFGQGMITVSYNTLPNHVAYAITRSFIEGSGYYKNIDQTLAKETPEGGLKIAKYLIHPYHPGSVTFYKEKGLWTSEMEKWQQNVLKNESETKASWKPSPK